MSDPCAKLSKSYSMIENRMKKFKYASMIKIEIVGNNSHTMLQDNYGGKAFECV